MIATRKVLPLLALALTSVAAYAADYYVAPAPTGSDDNTGTSSEAPFATIDKAIATATSSSDVIHVEPGTYSTTTQYGPDLKAKLVGTGANRGNVVIQSAGTYRTLRMAAGSWLENVTVVGCTDISKVDKGGAIEMSGGTVTNCVVRDGKAKGNDSHNAGGNVYSSSTASLIVDCVISGGTAQRRGGNVCLDQGTLRNCTVTGGSTSGGSQQNDGGNVWTYQGKIENCAISGGSAVLGGNVFIYNTNASLTGGTISDGTASQSGGNVYLRQGSISGATLSRGATTSNNNSQGGGNVYAEGNGGGATSISSCVLEDGTAKNRGGNVFLLAATLENSTVSGGKIVENTSGIGANVFMNHANALVSGCTVTGGEADARGGNIFMLAGTVQDSTVKDGVCANPTDQYWGGGNIFIQGGTISRCIVTGGSITGGQNRGGGISVQGDPAKVIEDTLVYGNANGGVYSAASNVQVWNCTIVDNAEFGFYRYGSTPTAFANCVLIGNKRSSDEGLANWSGNILTSAQKLASDDTNRFSTLGDEFVEISASDFVDYANGDYKPAASSKLVDAGVTDTRAGASITDLLGNTRTSGQVDIGCYEYQKSEMTVTFAYAEALEHAYAPVAASFIVSAQNVPEGQTPTYTIDFGDGSAPLVTTETSVAHEFSLPGSYTIIVRASVSGAADAEMTYTDFVSLKSQTVYVTAGSETPEFPYSTPQTGYATLKEAYDASVDGMTILVGNGVYEQTAKLAVSKAVSIVGNAVNPGAVVLKNTATASNGQGDKRVMSIDNAGATICGLTLEGGQVYHGNGGNLTISAGMISNCVIRGGIALADTDAEYGMGAGVALSGSGVVTHCVITNNEVRGTGSGKWLCGGAIVFPWGSSGKLSNSLVAGNRWVTGNDAETTVNGSAGIAYHGSTGGSTIDNCTIVANVIDGFCGPDSAAGVRCDWNSAIRNTAIAGNVMVNGSNGADPVASNVHLVFAEDVWKDGLRACATETALPSGNATCFVADKDEMFKNFEGGDYRPKAQGALFNKGMSLTTTPSVDLAGNSRVMFDVIDIGCYECQTKLGFSVVIR